MKKSKSELFVVAAMALALVSCGQKSQTVDKTVAATEAATSANEIQWFDGSVDAAFALAKAENKPIYLYWGAEWCPPCHAIKATVFRSVEFIARSKLFVPVYLDGDTENAQAVGEEFGVRGYPTMIVFDSGGSELTRIPGGIDIQAYANILDLTLGDLSPVGDLVEAVLAGEKELGESECRLLAYYSWNQNPELLEGIDEVVLYRNIYDACPGTLQPERSILYMAYLDVLIDEVDTESAGPGLDDEQIAEAFVIVDAILDDPVLLRANVFSVIFNGARMTRALTETGTESRGDLIARFSSAMTALAKDERVYKRERVYSVLGKLYLARIDDDEAAISGELEDEIRAMVGWADSSTTDPYERQAIINAASNVLDSAGMNDVARPLLVAELEKSRQPYYFMVSLADIEQNSGNYDEALMWLKKAYDESKGPATRFQWGYYYIAGLLEMTPDNADLIHNATMEVIRELEAGSGFYQRPKAQLARLEKSLLEWSEETGQSGVVEEIRVDMLTVCENFAEQQGSFDTCRSFLDPA